jgi:cobalt-zinc-cadmium efflux system outer membrane protein
MVVWGPVLAVGGCATPSLPYDPLAPATQPASASAARSEPAPPLPQVPWVAAEKSELTRAKSSEADLIARVSFQQEKAPPPRPLPLPAPTPFPTPEPGAGGLSLDQVINAVIVSDPKLRSGFEAINQSNADALTASLRPNPTLFTDAQLLPLTRPFTPTQQGGPPQQDVQVAYPIDWFVFGKRAANMAAAAHGLRASESDFADRVRLRVTDAVTAYYDVLEARGLYNLARQDVANLERVEAALSKTVEAGGRPQVELNRLRLDLLRSRQTLRDTQNGLVANKAKLRAMIGRCDADPDFDVSGSLEDTLAAEPPPPEEGFNLALENRPDLQAIRWRSARARANVLVEDRNAYPAVTPMFGYTRQYQTKAIGFPDANSWTAAVTMTLPVFDRNQGNRAKAASLLNQNEFDYRTALAELRAEIVSAAQEYRTAKANAESVGAEQLKLARDVLESITVAFGTGGRSLVDLLDAERNFRDTYRASITARAAYWRAVFRYSSAIGQKDPR